MRKPLAIQKCDLLSYIAVYKETQQCFKFSFSSMNCDLPPFSHKSKNQLFSRGHATLHLAVSVGRSVHNIFEFRAVFALLLLPNRPRLNCRVSGLVLHEAIAF